MNQGLGKTIKRGYAEAIDYFFSRNGLKPQRTQRAQRKWPGLLESTYEACLKYEL